MKANKLLLLSSLFLLTSCGAKENASSNESASSETSSIVEDSFSFSEKSMTVYEDTVSKIPYSSSGKVSFASSDVNVAEVSSDGTLLAKSVGETTITGTVGSVSDALKVNVVASSSSKEDRIKLVASSSPLSLENGDTYQIQATVIIDGKETQNPSISYSSSDENIAKVDSNGLVTPVKEGEASITVTFGELSAIFKADVYTKAIKTTSDWLAMISEENENNYGERYYLANDIDFSGVAYKGYVAIGVKKDDDHGFCGEINGFGHSLSNITMGATIDYHQSLFGIITGATIRNIAFENVVFSAAHETSCLNGIAAYSYVYSEGTVTRFNEFSNVYLDLVFPKEDVTKTGFFLNAYAASMDNVFLSMKTSDGSDFNVEKCGLLARSQYYWWGNSSISSSVFYSSSSLGLISSQGELDASKYGTTETSYLYLAKSEMDAIYGASTYLDSGTWDFYPTSYPSLKEQN